MVLSYVHFGLMGVLIFALSQPTFHTLCSKSIVVGVTYSLEGIMFPILDSIIYDHFLAGVGVSTYLFCIFHFFHPSGLVLTWYKDKIFLCTLSL